MCDAAGTLIAAVHLSARDARSLARGAAAKGAAQGAAVDAGSLAQAWRARSAQCTHVPLAAGRGLIALTYAREVLAVHRRQRRQRTG